MLPVYNEVEVLQPLLGQVRQALADCRVRSEIVFVDDGSTDGSARLLDQLAERYPEVRVIHFSRNFGHQAAVQAGLQHARGHAVVLMDSDLQDAPSAIGQFLERWREGYDVVYAVRVRRKEAAWKRALFGAFHRLMASVATTPIPAEAGNFSLIDARAVRQIVTLAERDRYLPGLRSWVGFRQIGIEVERNARYDAQPRVSLRGPHAIGEDGHFFVLVAAADDFLFYRMRGNGGVSRARRIFTLLPALHRPGDSRLDIVYPQRQFLRRVERPRHQHAGRIRRANLRPGSRPAVLFDRPHGEHLVPNSRRHGDAPATPDATDPLKQLLTETEELLELVDQSRSPEEARETDLRNVAETTPSINRV